MRKKKKKSNENKSRGWRSVHRDSRGSPPEGLETHSAGGLGQHEDGGGLRGKAAVLSLPQRRTRRRCREEEEEGLEHRKSGSTEQKQKSVSTGNHVRSTVKGIVQSF